MCGGGGGVGVCVVERGCISVCVSLHNSVLCTRELYRSCTPSSAKKKELNTGMYGIRSKEGTQHVPDTEASQVLLFMW